MSKVMLEVITPERVVYSKSVEMIITRAADGDIGILPKHAPFASPLSVTTIRVKYGKNEENIAIGSGFLEVSPAKITVLAESAEVADEIDVSRAEQAKERAKNRLDSGEGDMKRAEASLQRAVNRLNLVK